MTELPHFTVNNILFICLSVYVSVYLWVWLSVYLYNGSIQILSTYLLNVLKWTIFLNNDFQMQWFTLFNIHIPLTESIYAEKCSHSSQPSQLIQYLQSLSLASAMQPFLTSRWSILPKEPLFQRDKSILLH